MTVNYPRGQQLRRLRRAGARAIEAALALAGALVLAWTGEAALAFAALLLAAVLSLVAGHALRLAARSAVGAESEAQVRRVLERLVHEGWRVRHAVDWPGVGDLDHVVCAPSGIGFVVETKTRRYTRAHVGRTVDAARWLARRRRRYPAGVRPVVCVVRTRSVEHAQGGVLVVSLDRLLLALRAAAEAACPHTATFPTTASIRPQIAMSARLPMRLRR